MYGHVFVWTLVLLVCYLYNFVLCIDFSVSFNFVLCINISVSFNFVLCINISVSFKANILEQILCSNCPFYLIRQIYFL